MPKNINKSCKFNFSKSAQVRFDKFVENKNWSWVGLALALVQKFGVNNVESFHIVLGEVIKLLRNEEK